MNSQALGELASDQKIENVFHAYGFSIPVGKDGRRLWTRKFKDEVGQQMKSGRLSVGEGRTEVGLQSDGERDRLWKEFVEADIFPEEAFTLTTEGTRAAMDRAKASFLEKHGSTVESVLAQRG